MHIFTYLYLSSFLLHPPYMNAQSASSALKEPHAAKCYTTMTIFNFLFHVTALYPAPLFLNHYQRNLLFLSCKTTTDFVDLNGISS